MLAYNDNTISLPPSDKSIEQDATPINHCPKQLNSYANFLYQQANRISSRPVLFQEIQEFITTPDGLKGFKAYLTMCKPVKNSSKPKAVGDVLGEIL